MDSFAGFKKKHELMEDDRNLMILLREPYKDVSKSMEILGALYKKYNGN